MVTELIQKYKCCKIKLSSFIRIENFAVDVTHPSCTERVITDNNVVKNTSPVEQYLRHVKDIGFDSNVFMDHFKRSDNW